MLPEGGAETAQVPNHLGAADGETAWGQPQRVGVTLGFRARAVRPARPHLGRGDTDPRQQDRQARCPTGSTLERCQRASKRTLAGTGSTTFESFAEAWAQAYLSP